MLQALKDYFIALPNGIGAGFNVICLAFCFIFPAKSRSRLAGQADATANWGALRLQSVRRQPANGSGCSRDGGNGLGGSSVVAYGGFFDLTQFRWRTGRSFRLGSRFGSKNPSQRQDLTSTSVGGVVDSTGVTAGTGFKDSRQTKPGANHDGDVVKDVENGELGTEVDKYSKADNDFVNRNSSSTVDGVAVVPLAVAASACDSGRASDTTV